MIFGSIALTALIVMILLVFVYPYFYSTSTSTTAAVTKFLTVIIFLIVLWYFGLTIPEEHQLWAPTFMSALFGSIGLVMYCGYQFYGNKKAKYRKAGDRKAPIPFKPILIICTTLVVVGLTISWLQGEVRGETLLKLFSLSPFIFAMWSIAKKYENQSIGGDSENPVLPEKGVLYIRSFKTESDAFWSGYYTKSPLPIPAENAQQLFLQYSFTEFFEETFRLNISPIIGLGNPLDTIPNESHAMIYGQDGVWQKNILTMLQRCDAIVMTTGKSANLDWELSQVLNQKLFDKFFIFTPPTSPLKFLKFFEWFSFGKKDKFEWIDLVSQMKRLGYKLPEQPPMLGSIIAFDSEANGYVVAEGAFAPEDYVGVVMQCIESE